MSIETKLYDISLRYLVKVLVSQSHADGFTNTDLYIKFLSDRIKLNQYNRINTLSENCFIELRTTFGFDLDTTKEITSKFLKEILL